MEQILAEPDLTNVEINSAYSRLLDCLQLFSRKEAAEQTEATENPCLSRIVRIFFASSIFGNAMTMLLIKTVLLFPLVSLPAVFCPGFYRRYRYSSTSQSVTCLVYLSHSFFFADAY